jgi:hypothetical protein
VVGDIVPGSAHECGWDYRGHQHETDTGGLGPLAMTVGGLRPGKRTLVLQACHACGKLRVVALPGHWDKEALDLGEL